MKDVTAESVCVYWLIPRFGGQYVFTLHCGGIKAWHRTSSVVYLIPQDWVDDLEYLKMQEMLMEQKVGADERFELSAYR